MNDLKQRAHELIHQGIVRTPLAETAPRGHAGSTPHTTEEATGGASMPPQFMPAEEWMAPGLTIGKYELIRPLGHGGMGSVFLARHTQLGQRVAIKSLFVGPARVPEDSERLLAEARTTARCRHENIVVIHDVGVHDGWPYMVLEYLE